MRRVPIRVRGVDYPSVTAAALALGVAKSAVCRSLELGTLDRLGLSKQETTLISVTVPVDKADAIRALVMSEIAK